MRRIPSALSGLPQYGRVGITALASVGAVSIVLAVYLQGESTAQPAPLTRFAGPTSSQPLALTADGSFLVVVNPDNNSVSFFDLRSDRNRKLAEVPVQTEPNGGSIRPRSTK